jgi:hypothetical protein
MKPNEQHQKLEDTLTIKEKLNSEGGAIAITIRDQLFLWEQERHRVVQQPSFLYSQFIDTHEYDRAKSFAAQQGFLLLALDARRILVVSQIGHQLIKTYMKS